jgi:hypothetical protein
MTWLAALFTLAYAGQAFLLVILGTHAAHSLTGFAIGSAIVCGVLLWTWFFVLLARRPLRMRRKLGLAGIVLLTPAFFLPSLAGWYDQAELAFRISRTNLTDVTDEPLQTAAGNVIGMRIGFTVKPPETGYYALDPLVRMPQSLVDEMAARAPQRSLDPKAVDLRVVRRVIDPAPRRINASRLPEPVLDMAGGGLYLEGGVPYGFTFDLLPAYLLDPTDPTPMRSATDLSGYCMAIPSGDAARAAFDAMVGENRRAPYLVTITQTTYGADGTRHTVDRYSPAMFHQGMLKQGYRECPGR